MRKCGLIAIFTLVGLLLAGCGSSSTTNSSGSSTALRRINAAVGRTEAAGTAHLVTVAVTSRPSGSNSSAGGAATHLTAVGDIRFAGPEVKVTTSVQSGKPAAATNPTAIYIGSHTYLNVSSDPNSWVRAPYHQNYPYAYLGAVQATALTTTKGPVTVAGTDQVDGQPATKYLVPIPRTTRTVALTNSENKPYNEYFRTTPFVLSVWLDGDGRIVRTQATQTITTSEASWRGRAVESSTTTLSDFGEPVQITAPSISSGQ